MAQITRKGRELSDKLNPSIGTTQQILEVCSLICRHATTHCRIQEQWCNGVAETSRVYWEKREEETVLKLKELVTMLPHINDQPIGLRLGGDPRGATVILVMPDGRYDDWGQRGLCVPGS
jgi:hypothetical protein